MRRRAATLASILVAAPLLATTALTPVVAAETETVTIGDYGLWTVPAGVTSVMIELTGGDGGTATGSSGLVAIGQGGRGGALSAILPVEAGDELFFRVGTAGSGIDVANPPIDELAGGTGDGAGGNGFVSGGGSTSVSQNGTLVAGAPGGGGGAAIWASIPATLFVTDGGAGGMSAADVIDGGATVLAGGAAGGNFSNPINDGQSANRSANAQYVLANGAGGAGWPGGGAASNEFGSGNPVPIYLAGGGGGLAFIGETLLDVVIGPKNEAIGRDGSATLTYTPATIDQGNEQELAATGASAAFGAAALGLVLLVAGGLAVARDRRAMG